MFRSHGKAFQTSFKGFEKSSSTSSSKLLINHFFNALEASFQVLCGRCLPALLKQLIKLLIKTILKLLIRNSCPSISQQLYIAITDSGNHFERKFLLHCSSSMTTMGKTPLRARIIRMMFVNIYQSSISLSSQ